MDIDNRSTDNNNTELQTLSSRQLSLIAYGFFSAAFILVLFYWTSGEILSRGHFFPVIGAHLFENDTSTLIFRYYYLAISVFISTLFAAFFYYSLSALGFTSNRLTSSLESIGTILSERYRVIILFALVALLFVIRAQVLLFYDMTDDEGVYRFIANLLQSFKIVGDSLPMPARQAFNYPFIVNDGRWFGQYFIGWPAIIALVEPLGLYQLINPILAALTIYLLFVSAGLYFGKKYSPIVYLLAVASPFFLLTNATTLAYTSAGCAMALAILGFIRVICQHKQTTGYLFIGIGLAAGELIRPDSAFPLGLALLGALFIHWIKKERPTLLQLALAGLPIVAATLIIGGVNWAQSGDPFQTGYAEYLDFYQKLFNQKSQDFTRDFIYNGTPLAVGESEFLFLVRKMGLFTITWISRLSLWLFATPLIVLILANVRWNRLVESTLGLAFLFRVGLENFHSTPGINLTGPVHSYPFWPVLAFLTLSGLIALWRILDNDRLKLGLVSFCLGSAVTMSVTFLPAQIMTLHQAATEMDETRQSVEAEITEKSVVFIQGPFYPVTPPTLWVKSCPIPMPDLSEDIIYAKFLNQGILTEVARLFPDRKLYVLKRNLDLVNGKQRLELNRVILEDERQPQEIPGE